MNYLWFPPTKGLYYLFLVLIKQIDEGQKLKKKKASILNVHS